MKNKISCPEEIISRKEELTENMERLDNPLKVGMVIYRMDRRDMRPYFSCLVEIFDGIMSRNDVSHAIDTLTDWGVIYGEYGKLYEGRAGYIYYPDYLDMDPEDSTLAKLEREIGKKN